MEIIKTLLEIISPISNYLFVTAAVWVAYCYALKCEFCSDDFDGIVNYDGKLQGPEYGMISRWLRYHLAGGDFPSKIKLPSGQVLPQGKVPWRHHFLILSVFNVASLLIYHFLANALGVKIALLTTLLFVVHPVCTQAVAWASALGYPLSLLWIGAMLCLVQNFYLHPTIENTIFTTVVFCLFQFLGVHAQFIPMATCVILAFFGYWPFAILAGVISLVMSFGIIKKTIDFRKAAFKEQRMIESTFLKPRKFIVAMKTFLYYLGLSVWPNKMGLYHKWGFHYGPDLEREDRTFFIGLLALVSLVAIFFLTPIVPLKLGILWFIAFSVIFWNWVTIQQFVTERYIFIPTLGLCMILAYFLQAHLAIYGFILGAYLCRTWLHLPTYDNELRFYQSNVWNFPDSEVAYGNLGVTYMRMGALGTAIDCWNMSIRVNPEYDVPYYNIFSTYRSNGYMAIQNGDYMGGLQQLQAGLPYLEKTLNCKICHFPDVWKKEHAQLASDIKNPLTLFKNEEKRLTELLAKLHEDLKTAENPQRSQDILLSVQNIQLQLNGLKQFIAQIELSQKPPAPPPAPAPVPAK